MALNGDELARLERLEAHVDTLGLLAFAQQIEQVKNALWRHKADERLALLDLVTEVWDVDERDVRLTTELRALSEDERVQASNACFRVLYDLDKRRKERA